MFTKLAISLLLIILISAASVGIYLGMNNTSNQNSAKSPAEQVEDFAEESQNTGQSAEELSLPKSTPRPAQSPRPVSRGTTATPTVDSNSDSSSSDNSDDSDNDDDDDSDDSDDDENDGNDPQEEGVWVATTGSDTNSGTSTSPLATINAALVKVEDGGTIYVKDGTYNQNVSLDSDHRFTTMTTIKAENALKARLQYADSESDSDQVIKIDGAKNVTISGFDITSSAAGCAVALIDISGGNNLAAENIVISNNVIHDVNIADGCANGSPGDLIKALSDGGGVTKLKLSSNVFYNQGPGEEHLDINGVYGSSETDYGAQIVDNIHFNNFDTEPDNETQAFLTIKDSLGDTDAAGPDTEGARHVYVERNAYLNWQGRTGTQLIQVGNDGKSYYEAQNVVIRNNLIQGNSSDTSHGALQIANVNNVKFIYNTISGDLPQGSSGQYAFHYSLKGTPGIEPDNIVVKNNIFSDPTGTYGQRTDTSKRHITRAGGATADGLTHESNVYYNGGDGFASVTSSTGFPTPLTDATGTIGNPVLSITSVDLPIYNFGTALFESGTQGGSYTAIQQELTRIITAYADLGNGSVAIGAADDVDCPDVDIRGNARPDTGCDAGAWEE